MTDEPDDDFSLYAPNSTDVVRVWLDPDAELMMKVISSGADPVELTPDEARTLAAALNRLADRQDEIDDSYEHLHRLGP